MKSNKLKNIIIYAISIVTIVGLMVLVPSFNRPKLIDKYTSNGKQIQEYKDGSWKVYDNIKEVYTCHVKDGSSDGENNFDNVENMEMFYSNFYNK